MNTREALLAARKLMNSIPHSRAVPDYVHQQAADLVNSLTTLTEPFDPAKHLSGWNQLDNPSEWWIPDSSIGKYTLIKRDLWAIYHHGVVGQGRGGIIFSGHIPTLSFFHALCEALNIK